MTAEIKNNIVKTSLGGVTNNPVFVLVLGMCPMLAMSVSVKSAFYLALATCGVLIASNVLISLLRRIIPDKIRIPCYLIVIATFVTIADMLLKKFLPSELYNVLASAISLIVVNCIILARAESFASQSNVGLSALDGVSMGVGFAAAILLLAGFREFLTNICKLAIFGETAGGFLALAILMAIFNYIYAIINRRLSLKKRVLINETEVA